MNYIFWFLKDLGLGGCKFALGLNWEEKLLQ